jgi:drug/metabolite transporter (DMT)-like permease
MAGKINWDAWGIGASLACAIHCALLPLFFTSLPLFGINIIQNAFFEVGMMMLALVIGVWSIYHGYKKHHHSIIPLAIFFSGFAFLVLKEFFSNYEVVLLIPGVLLIITAHIYNYRSCRVHNHAHKEDCDL